MRAFEFDSIVNDDAIIIPEKYRGYIRSNMRVIVLGEESEATQKPRNFLALRLHTKGVKFSRELANER